MSKEKISSIIEEEAIMKIDEGFNKSAEQDYYDDYYDPSDGVPEGLESMTLEDADSEHP